MDASYSVHDTRIQDQTGFGVNGTVETKTVVTFYVGAHGPFRLEYRKSEATGERIQQDINAQVALLQGIPGATATTTPTAY